MVVVTTKLTVMKKPCQGRFVRVYFVHDEEHVLDQLLWRRGRPVQWYLSVLPAVLQDAEVQVRAEGPDAITVARWEQNAGCQCGCSPGFLLDSPAPCEVYVRMESHIERVPRSPDQQPTTL